MVDNKGGGSGVIGINALSKASNGGYTIGNMTHSPIVVVPHIRSVPYHPINDFTFIMQYGEFMHAFCVLLNSPWKTLKEYIEDSRKNAGKLTYSTPGPLSVPHIFIQQLAMQENIKINHVPVQGDAEMATVHLGGHVDATLGSTMIPHIPSGKVRGLAVASAKRFDILPDVPTFPELGYNMDYPNFTGFIAPKGVDPRIVKKLEEVFKKALDDPSFKEFCVKVASTTPLYRDSGSFKAVVVGSYEQLGVSLKKTGLAK